MQPGAQDSAQSERNAKRRIADSLELDDVQSLVAASSATNVVIAAFVLVAPSAADDTNSAATAAAVGQLVFPLLVVLVD